MAPIIKSPLAEILSEWNLSIRAQDHCEKYYLLHWEGSYLSNKILEGYGTISHQEFEYLPLYRECLPSQVCRAKQVALSFRKLTNESFPYGYVMIRILER